MGKLIEYTLISVDGVFDNPVGHGFMGFRDDAYIRDGLGLLCECDAMIMGRNFFEGSAQIWTSRSDHPWADRLNGMRKYIFSSTLRDVSAWENSVLVGGDAVKEIAKIKDESRGDLVIWGHTQLAETFMRACLVDVMDVSIHPVLSGGGGLLLREGLNLPLRLVATKCFTNIVKITYETDYAQYAP
jgi:dihydrofolate reductase